MPIVLIVSLSLVAILMSKLLLQSVQNDYQTFSKFFSKYYTVNVNPIESGVSLNAIQDELNWINGVDSVVLGITRRISITSLIGANPYMLHFVDSTKTEDFLTNTGWKLTEGRLPKPNEAEVALTQEAMRNKKLKIGDKIGDSLSRYEVLRGEYVVVGVLEGSEVNGGIGVIDLKNLGPVPSWTFYIKPLAGQETQLENSLESLKDKWRGQITIETYESILDALNYQFSSLNQILWGLNILIASVMTISVVLLSYIYLSNRSREFAILDALGYPKKYLTTKVVSEFAVLAFAAWILGILLSELISMLVNVLIFKPMAISSMTVFDSEVLIFSLPMFLIVMVSLVFLVTTKLYKMDPVLVIEKRN